MRSTLQFYKQTYHEVQNTTLRYIFKRKENMLPLVPNVHGTFIYKRKDLLSMDESQNHAE